MTGIVHKRVVKSKDKGLAVDWNDDHEITGNVDQDQKQFLNQVIENRTDWPAGPVEGQVIYRKDEHKFYVWNGTGWSTLIYTDANARGAINNIFGADGHADKDISMSAYKIINLDDPVDVLDAANKRYVDDTAGVGWGTQIGHCASSVISVTRYIHPVGSSQLDHVGFSSTESVVTAMIPKNGTIKNLYINAAHNSKEIASSTITLRKNGANTGLALTWAAGETGLKSDTSTEVSVNAGDVINFMVTSSGSGSFGNFTFGYNIS